MGKRARLRASVHITIAGRACRIGILAEPADGGATLVGIIGLAQRSPEPLVSFAGKGGLTLYDLPDPDIDQALEQGFGMSAEDLRGHLCRLATEAIARFAARHRAARELRAAGRAVH